MINKERILKVDIYNNQGKRIVSSNSVSFPRDFFGIKGQELVMIKAKDLPELNKAEPIVAIFEYLNGDRMRYDTKIDICTEFQMNFHVGRGELLEERRASFKLSVEFEGYCKYFERDEGGPLMFENSLPLKFHNINLGGVLVECDYDFIPGDRIDLTFMDGQIEIIAEVLRIQINQDGEKVGFGCKFLNLTHQQEEIIAKFILDCQVAERERRRNKGY